jgi:hypothetical protein
MPGYAIPSGTMCHKCLTEEEFLGEDCHPLPDDEIYRCGRCFTRCRSPRA